MIKKNFSKRSIVLWIVALMTVFTALGAVFANASTDVTRPTIISISPSNNGLDIATHDVITAQFSEPMDASTINTNTFIVMQRTTPRAGSLPSEYRSLQVEGTVAYSGLTATFTPKNLQSNPLQPSQEFGNVFTATITNGAKDLAGNSLSQDYMWSFTTGISSFNTGATTSQQDQSAIPVVSAIVPVTQPPASAVVPVTTTATNNLSWIWWAVAGAFLLLIIALVISVFNATPQKNKKYIQSARPSPFGDVHPVMDIEGIGPEYTKRLHTMGIKNTKQLWGADAVKIARGTGASLSSVRGWQQMAELASVKDIGPQYAELLERSGVHSINQLKSYDTDKLLKMINQKQDSLKINIQGNSPGHATVEHWIDEARDHKFTEPAVGQIA